MCQGEYDIGSGHKCFELRLSPPMLHRARRADDGLHRARHPLGSQHIERQALSMCPVHGLRPQGRHAPASGMGWCRSRLPAVSYAPARARRAAVRLRAVHSTTGPLPQTNRSCGDATCFSLVCRSKSKSACIIVPEVFIIFLVGELFMWGTQPR